MKTFRNALLKFAVFLFSFNVAAQQKAISFDGINDYIDLSALNAPLQANQNHFTFELWMKANSANHTAPFGTLISFSNAAAGLKLALDVDGNGAATKHLRLLADANLHPNELIWESSAAVANDTCQHIAFSYDGINQVAKVYINGTLVATETIVLTFTSTDIVELGRNLSATGSQNAYNGLLSKVRFFNYVRSDAEIFQNLYTNYTGAESELFALYLFNEGTVNGNNTSISTAIDSSPNAYNGMYNNFQFTAGATSNFVSNPCVANVSVIQGSTDQTLNYNCNGNPCFYDGPTILINELMISPTSGDGSISSATSSALSTQRGEWIELYNPNICEPVDISCYYLGNYTYEGTGGFVIPAGTVVPPGGFCVLRGVNAASVPAERLYVNGGNVVEIVFPPYINSEGNCTNGTRIWFPNLGGWFAFYDQNGVVQDAVAWGTGNITDRAGNPCVPNRSGCTAAASLMSYNQIPDDRKAVASTVDGSAHMGRSIRRDVDGGTWIGAPAVIGSYADCNAACVTMGVSTCNGTATVTVSGGTAPYTYSWNDSQLQNTPTATGLCEGVYEVVVADAIGNSSTFSVTIVNNVPVVDVNTQASICLNSPSIAVQVSPVPAGAAVGLLTGAGITNYDFSPATADLGTHTLVYNYTDEFGCQNVDSTAILVNPLPQLTWNIAPSYCIPSAAHQLNLTPTGGTLAGPGTSGISFDPMIAGAGTHTISYTYTDGNSCSNVISDDVIVHQTIPAAINPPAYVCVDEPTFVVTGNLPFFQTMTINGQNVMAGIDPQHFGPGNYVIQYAGADANQCPSTVTATMEIKPLPTPTLTHPATICLNVDQVTVQMTPAGGMLTGDLLNGNNIIPLSGQSGMVYNLNYAYTDQFGCANTTTSSYQLLDALEPTLNYTTDCFFNANIVENYKQFASVSFVTDGVPMHTENGYVFNYPVEGEYLITVNSVDKNGCTSTADILADIPVGLRLPDYQVPNVITANGDNVNDVLKMSAKYDECVEYEIVIVNRWGHHVYTATKQDPFKGIDKGGNEVGDGVYFFEVITDDVDYKNETYKPFKTGFITVVK